MTALEPLLDPDGCTPLLHQVEPTALAGDEGHNAKWVRERIAAVGWQSIIPIKKNESREDNPTFDREL